MWNERYNRAEYVFGTEPNDFLKENFQKIPVGGKVLCLAEGEGRNAVFLAEQGYQVTAMDMSNVGLNKALKLAQDRGVDIITQVADLAHYELGKVQWDSIVASWAHLPPARRQHVHEQIAPALKPEGVFILEAYTEQQLSMDDVGGHPAKQKERFGSLAVLRAELAELEELTGIDKRRMMSEGKRQLGWSEVVQPIAKKTDEHALRR